jgi:cystathionine beta-lyase
MFDFDEVVDRKGTNCAKWDTIEANNKPKDVLPRRLWVFICAR